MADLSILRFSRRKPAVRNPSRKLSFEHLEDRFAPAVYTVNSALGGNDINGLSLRDAIGYINSGTNAFPPDDFAQIDASTPIGTDDTVAFAPSLIGGTIALGGSVLGVNRSMTVAGLGADRLTLDAGSASRIFNVDADATVLMYSLTLVGGSSGNNGGAIINAGNLTIEDCAFENNSAAGNGGAIQSTGTLALDRSTFANNSVFLSGGAVNLGGSGTATITNSTFSGNSAAANGGAINANSSASLTAINCTFIGNRADTDGVGPDVSGSISHFATSTVTLHNSIVAGNLRGSGAGVSDDLSSPLTANSSNNLIGNSATAGGLTHGVNGNIVGNNGAGAIPAANIVSLTLADHGGQTRTHALVAGSLAFDAGSNARAAGLADDQRGSNRIAGAAVDIGSFEYQGFALDVVLAGDTGASPTDGITSAYLIDGLVVEPSGIVTLTAKVDGGPIIDIRGDLNDNFFSLSATRIQALNGNASLPLSQGAHVVFFAATDIRGAQVTKEVSFFFDDVAPALPTVGLAPNFDTGTLGDLSTSATVVTLQGTAEPFSVVRLVVNSLETVAAANGTYSFAGVSLPIVGSNQFTAEVRDLAGNISLEFRSIVRVAASLQTVTAVPIDATPNAGGAVSVAVNYNVSPADATLAGLTLRLHYNSNALTFNNLSSVLALNVQPTQMFDDTSNLDGDASTDKIVLVAWSDGGGNWPGTLPRQLYAANFTAATNFVGATTVRFSATPAPGYEFFGAPATLNVMPAYALVVTTATDELDADLSNAGDLSLREAVFIANNRAGADTISFASSINSVSRLTTGQLRLTDNAATTIVGPQTIFRRDDSGTPNFRLFEIQFGAVVNVERLDFSGGETDDNGGAIFNSGTLTVSNSRVYSGEAKNGAGIANNGVLFLNESTVFENSARFKGGGLLNENTAVLRNVTIYDNTSVETGGGIANTGTLIVDNATITDNRSNSLGTTGNLGGGLFAGGSETLRNSIVYGNFAGSSPGTANDIEGAVESAAFTLVGAGTGGIVNGVGGNIVGVNPLLGETTDNGGSTNTFALGAGSPAINAGSNALIPSGVVFDQRGYGRISGGTVDLGAFEKTLQAGPYVVDVATDVADGNTGPGQLSLREAILLANDFAGADTIRFAPNLTAAGPATIALTGDAYNVSDDLTIVGPGAKSLILDGAAATGFFTLFEREFGISGLTLQNGSESSAIYSVGALLTVTDCILQNNQSSASGAAIQIIFSHLIVTGSTLTGNRSGGAGGAIFLISQSFAEIVNSTIAHNSAANSGGGIASSSSSPGLTILNSTIVSNLANTGNGSNGGGGVFSGSSNPIVMNNSIVAANRRGSSGIADDIDDSQLSGGNNIVGTSGPVLIPLGSIVQTKPDGTALVADNGGPTPTVALVQNSPAIGAGSDAVAGYTPYDQRKTPRDAGDPDIGAYEVQHPLSPVGVPTDYAATFQPKPSANANTAFIKGLYQSTLLRAGEADGIGYWLGQLGAGVARQDVAFGFVNSFENRANQVTFFYRYFLGRASEPTGLNFHVKRLQDGIDESVVMTGFILSSEYAGLNPSNASLVNLLYYAVLGRQSEADGFNFWTGKLAAGTSRDEVVDGFLRSTEGIVRILNSDFASYLKHALDAGSKTFFLGQIQNEKKTFGNVAAQVLGSPEFFVAAGNHL